MSPPEAASEVGPLPARGADGLPGRRRTRRRTSARQRQLLGLVIVASTLAAAALTEGRPTELWLIDAMYRGAFAAGLCWVTSRARRRTWPLLAGVSIVLASNWLLLGAAIAATAMVAASINRPRHRLVGAMVGGVTALVLLSLDLPGPGLTESVVVVVVCASTLVSALLVLPPTTVRRIRRGAGIAALAAVVAVLAAVATIFFAAGDLRRGVTASQAGLEAVRDGDVADARVELDQAAADLGRASAWLTSPLAQPARLVPIAGQHVRAAQVTSAEATALTAAAADAAAVVDTERLRPTDGAVDLAAFDPAVAPLERLHLTVDRAVANLASIESPWLLPPAGGPLDELREGLDAIAPAAEIAAVAARDLPTLLGRDTPQHYLVLLTTPAEARGAGGFVGSWLMVRADDGRVDLLETGRADDLNQVLESAAADLVAPLEYEARWGRFDPARHFQDITFSPDYPTVASVAAGLARQTDRSVDGVIAMDPYGLEALLSFTGPVDVVGTDARLTERNAADYLLREQYVAFADDTEREQALTDTTGELFERLLGADFPSLGAVRDVLGPAVAANRLVAWTENPSTFFAVSGLDGAFPHAARTTGDFLAVVHQNSAQNKIDVYHERAVDYRATVHPESGEVVANVRVTMTNTAPASGLPDSVIGSNDQGLPAGTNRQYVSVYSPHLITAARLDGEEHLMETNVEFGWQTYSTYVEIPAGATATLEIDLAGHVAEPGDYTLTVAPQPVVNPDRYTVAVRQPAGALVSVDRYLERPTTLNS